MEIEVKRRLEIENRLKKILLPYVKNPAHLENLTPASTLTADLEIDSLRLVDILIAVEDEFKIAVDDNAIKDVKNYGDTISMINKLMAQDRKN